MSQVTIAIVTRNRPQILEENLEHLASLGLLSHVLIIDGSNDERTIDLCNEFGVPCYTQKSIGMTAARNDALDRCESKFIAFIDDDSFVSETWFKRITEALESGYSGVTGKLLNEKSEINGLFGALRKILFESKDAFGEISASGVIKGDFFYNERKTIDHMPGCNMAYNTDDLRSVGGFDESVDVGNSYREDTIASYKVSQVGTLLYDPRASVNHRAIEETGDIKKWHFYNPYLTQYFLREYEVIDGIINQLKFWGIQLLRHTYFALNSIKRLDSSYAYYICGELAGIKDFIILDNKPNKYV